MVYIFQYRNPHIRHIRFHNLEMCVHVFTVNIS